jgi:chaperonin GroES
MPEPINDLAALAINPEPETGIPPDMMQEDVPVAEEEVASPAIQTNTTHGALLSWIDRPNIADELDDDLLNKIGQRVTREFDIDLNSRSDWEDRSRIAMDLAMQIAKAKTHPWSGSSNIVYPLMTTAAVQFAARAYPAIIPGRNVVKGVVVGPDKGVPQLSPQDGTPLMQMGPDGQPQVIWAQEPGSKKARADRIGGHMSWQLLDEMKEWVPETDKMLHILPIIGCVFRKSYYDPTFGCNSSVMVQAENCVINYWAKSMDRAPRISEILQLYPNEIIENERKDLFLEQKYGLAEDSNGDDDAPHKFIEQHRLLDLDEDGYAEPYCVTVHKTTGKVCRIKARYDADGVHIKRSDNKVIKVDPVHYYTKYDFLPSFDGGIYGTGFGQLLGPINSGVNTTLNMMFDAEHLKITGGGFIGRGLSLSSGSTKFKLGEWKVVNAPGQSVRDAVVPMQHPGASAVMFQLLGMLIEAGKEVASVKDALTGETAAATMQPTTLLALIEQGLKVFTAIYKRVHDAAKDEFDKLYRLNRIYLEHQARYKDGDEWKTVTKEDYAKGAGVKPYSDPAMVSDMQKMGRAQFLQSYQNDPLCDGVEIRKRVMDAAGIEDPDKIVHGQMPPNPQIIAETAKMELEGHKADAQISTERSKQVLNYASALNYMAQADKAVGDQHIGWLGQQIDIVRLRMEQTNGKAADDGGGAPQQPKLLAPSAEGPAQTSDGMPPEMMDLLGQGPDGAPIPGAERAPDGNWYVPDNNRPGKFMRVST